MVKNFEEFNSVNENLYHSKMCNRIKAGDKQLFIIEGKEKYILESEEYNIISHSSVLVYRWGNFNDQLLERFEDISSNVELINKIKKDVINNTISETTILVVNEDDALNDEHKTRQFLLDLLVLTNFKHFVNGEK